MLPIYRHKWFHRIVRANTQQVPPEEAHAWRRKLAIVYGIAAVGLYAAARYIREIDRSQKKEKYGELDEARYWLQKVGHTEATVVRVQGFSSYTVEDYNLNQLREEEAAKLKAQEAANLTAKSGEPQEPAA